MTHAALKDAIDAAWEGRAELTPQSQGPVGEAVETALALLDSGAARVASPTAKAAGRCMSGSRKPCSCPSA